MITAERLREILHYNPETGKFTWLLTRKGRATTGREAGCVDNRGYVKIRIEYKFYRAARIACLYMTGEWPPNDVDHINLIKHDNRWCNLRLATRSQNRRNTRKRKGCSSQLKGVSWDKQRKMWKAHIRQDGKVLNLGRFALEHEAYAAYINKVSSMNDEFIRVA